MSEASAFGRKSPLVLKSLSEQVYDHLRHLLNRGELRPGAYLDLDALETRLGVSRTPLRDALLQLHAESFVTILPRRGVQVRPLTREDVRHLYEIIGALEGAALLAAFPRLGAAEAADLRRLNAEMKEAVDANDFDGYYERNLAFHGVFLETVRRLGRVYEVGLIGGYNTLSGHLFDSMDLGWPMLVRGKVKPLPPRVRSRREVAAIFARAEARRAKEVVR